MFWHVIGKYTHSQKVSAHFTLFLKIISHLNLNLVPLTWQKFTINDTKRQWIVLLSYYLNQSSSTFLLIQSTSIVPPFLIYSHDIFYSFVERNSANFQTIAIFSKWTIRNKFIYEYKVKMNNPFQRNYWYSSSHFDLMAKH